MLTLAQLFFMNDTHNRRLCVYPKHKYVQLVLGQANNECCTVASVLDGIIKKHYDSLPENERKILIDSFNKIEDGDVRKKYPHHLDRGKNTY